MLGSTSVFPLWQYTREPLDISAGNFGFFCRFDYCGSVREINSRPNDGAEQCDAGKVDWQWLRCGSNTRHWADCGWLSDRSLDLLQYRGEELPQRRGETCRQNLPGTCLNNTGTRWRNDPVSTAGEADEESERQDPTRDSSPARQSRRPT